MYWNRELVVLLKMLDKNREAILTSHCAAQACPLPDYSHHFHPSHPGIVAAKGRDLTRVVANVPGPGLADGEGAVFLQADAGAARWIYDNVVLLPNIPDCHSISDR